MSGLGRGGKEPYWTQKAPDQQGRLIGLPFQEFLNLRDPVSNPGLGWNREGDLPSSLEHLEVRLQRVDAPFGLEDGVTQRPASPPLGHELDEVCETALLSLELALSQPHLLRYGGRRATELLLDSLEEVPEGLCGTQAFADVR